MKFLLLLIFALGAFAAPAIDGSYRNNMGTTLSIRSDKDGNIEGEISPAVGVALPLKIRLEERGIRAEWINPTDDGTLSRTFFVASINDEGSLISGWMMTVEKDEVIFFGRNAFRRV